MVDNLTGTLNDRTTVTFSLSLALISGESRPFVAIQVPTFSSADFGTAGYTEIFGTATLYGADNPIPNYTLFLANAERTNIDESWVWNTNGGIWNQLAGLGTNTVTITGTGSGVQAAYVLTTRAPTQVNITVKNGTNSR